VVAAEGVHTSAGKNAGHDFGRRAQARPRGPGSPLCYHPAARTSGRLRVMPNIKQQEKRVRIASRQRLENLRYRSTIKRLARRLETAVADGDAETIADEHRALVRTIDKAASHGALHQNTAARKKSQAARLVAGS
jgi:small subunit ribosomal protein S20